MVFIVRYLHDKTSRASERVRNTSSKCPGTPGKFLEVFGGFENRLEVSVTPQRDIACSSGERAILKMKQSLIFFISDVIKN